MRSFAVVAGFVAAANAWAYNYTTPAYPTTTVVTTDYTTVCPGPTEIPVGTKTYTVTEATTLTITDCPCTFTYTPTPVPSTPAYTPVAPSSSPAPYYPSYPAGNSSVPVGPTGTTVPTVPVYPTSSKTPTPSEFPGAAGKTGLSLLAVAGALAAFL